MKVFHTIENENMERMIESRLKYNKKQSAKLHRKMAKKSISTNRRKGK